jgi:hypothetical protein
MLFLQFSEAVMAEFPAQASQQVNTTTAGDQVHAVTSALPTGGHIVAWTTGAGADAVVMAQAYDASGAKTGGELTLVHGYSAGGIAALADGTLVVGLTRSTVDSNGPHSAIAYELFDMAGRALGAPVVIDDTGNYDVWLSVGDVFARPGGGFAVEQTSTWRPVPFSTVNHSIRLFDASGAQVGAVAAGEYWREEIQQMANGGYVAASQPYTGPSPSEVDWRVVDAQGQVTASATLKSIYGQTNYGVPSVVALANGTALVVWQFSQYTNGAYQSSWQGQWIDAGGHASGGIFAWQFADFAALHLTALAGGGFLATGSAASRGGAPYDLFGQAFDAAARPIGSEQHLATLDSSDGAYGSGYTITATADGGFLLDYQASADGQDIFEQKFNPAGQPSGGGIPGESHAFIGTAGIDTISFAGAHTRYSVTPTSVNGPEGAFSLSGIERIRFADDYGIALDVNGHAGQAYRLYQAAFDRQPDLPGLGYQMNDLDIGYSLSHVAANFIASPEFQSKYSSDLSDTQFITLLYEHVLDREPESKGLQDHLDELARGYSRADVLTFFSESPENQANVIGQIQDGMLFVPVA